MVLLGDNPNLMTSTLNMTYTITRTLALAVGVLFNFAFLSAADYSMQSYSIADTAQYIKIIAAEANPIIVLIRDENTPKLAKTAALYSKIATLDSALKVLPNGYQLVGYGKNQLIEAKVGNLVPETKYIVEVYKHTDDNSVKLDDDFSFKTVVRRPEKNSYNIVYKKTQANEMNIIFRKGKGQNHIVVVRKGAQPLPPKSGTKYEANESYGKGSDLGDGSFVVYNGESTEVTIKDLQPNTQYHLRIFDYNGNGANISYNFDAIGGNPSSKRTLLDTPTKLENFVVAADHFEPKWQQVDGATTYEIDIATDKEFTNILPDYKGIDVGNVSQFYIDGLDKNKVYFWRVTAKNDTNRSNPSENLKIEIQ